MLSPVRTHDVDEKDIAKVFRLIDSVFVEETGYSIIDPNGEIYLNVLQFNHHIFPGLYGYFAHKKTCELVFDKDRGLKILKPRETKML